jgi:hypothetical protein
MSTSTPIACTLTPGDYEKRLAWITTLNRSALRSHRLSHGTLELRYAPEAIAQVRDLVRREEQCCAFLRFTVRETSDALVLTIEAPEDARAASDILFEPFLHGAANGNAQRGLDQQQRYRVMRRGFAVGPASAAAAALACGVCCVLPFAFPAVMLTTLGSAVAFFGRAYWWALGLAVAAVAVRWGWVALQSVRTRRRPARSTLRAMGIATTILIAATGWSYIEPSIRELLRC